MSICHVQLRICLYTHLFVLYRDTAGQERYKSLAPMYYRSANAAIVVYSLNSLDSLQSARNWIKELKRQGEANTIIILVGNKSDLPELSKKVTQNDVQNLLTELEIKFHFECSAKTGLNVNQLFETIANNLPIKEIKELNKVNKQQQSLKLDQQSQTSSNQDNCAC